MNRCKASFLGVLAGALALILTPSCIVEESAPGPDGDTAGETDSEAEGALLWAATWSLTWDKSRTVSGRNGGWSVETNLGYRVTVTSGWFVDHSLTFGPCDTSSGSESGTSAALRFLGLGVRQAHAHSGADPSAIEAMYAEDLARPAGAGPWPTVFAKARYCKAHWLVARATSKLDAPEEVALHLDGRSLRLSGKWERDGVSQAFEVDTWWPGAHLADLEDLIDPAALAEARADGEPRAARVIVKRELGALFDGIDFEVDPEEWVTGTVVDNLAANVAITVELFQPES